MKPRIFISYARKDGETFALDLRTRLSAEYGEEALWRDRDRMEGGRDWWLQIVAALETVEFMVLVATPEAMASPTVRKEWRAARQMGVCVCPVLVPGLPIDFDVLPRWMRDSHFYNIDKEWNTFVAFLTSPCEVPKVPFMAPDLPTNFVERVGPFEELKTRLLDSDRQNPIAVTTALQGAGGFGKTTLAIALCHDEEIQTAFDDGILWATVGETPDIVGELVKLYRALTGRETAFQDADEGGRIIAEKLSDLDCLIVIDDVWNSAHLQPILRGGTRCARLITTRDIGIAVSAKAVKTEVDEMTSNEAVELLGAGLDGAEETVLRKLAVRLGEYAQMLEIANGMVHERIAVSGDTAAAAFNWLNKVLDRKGIVGVRRDNETTRKRDISGVLESSIELLTPDQRQRLYKLGVFKEDEAIPLSSVMRLWRIEEFDAEDLVLKLARLALIKYSSSTGAIRIHDVIREYLLTQISDVPRLHTDLVEAWGEKYDLPDGYAWRFYVHHLRNAGKLEDSRALLTDFKWLQAKLIATDSAALLADFDVAHDDHALALIQSAIRLSLNAITVDKDQLAPQLTGRLYTHRAQPGISTLFADVVYPYLTFKSESLHFPSHIQAGGALLRTLFGHGGWVNGALALDDGRFLSWSKARTLHLWHSDGSPDAILTGHGNSVRGAVVLADGRFLSWSDDKTLRLWHSDGSPDAILTGHNGSISGALVLADGRFLSWSRDKTLRLWRSDGSPDAILTGHNGPISGVLALADGRFLSWSDDRFSQDKTLRLWHSDGSPDAIFTGHNGSISGALVLADGRFLSWGDDYTLRLWHSDGSPDAILTGHGDSVTGALALDDGRFLSWSDDYTLRLWHSDGSPDAILAGHSNSVTDALVLADGRFLSWSRDNTLRLWHSDGSPDAILTGHGRWVSGALALDDGRFLSWSHDKTLRLWRSDGFPDAIFVGHSNSVTGALATNGGRFLSWSRDKTLRLWRSDGSPDAILTGHVEQVRGTLALADGRFLSWSDDHTLRLWRSDGSPDAILTGHRHWVIGALALDDGRFLSWSCDHTLQLWRSDGSPDAILTGHSHWVGGALALADGRFLSWSLDHTLRLWHGDGSPDAILTGHTAPVRGALALADGRFLSWSLDHTLRLWHSDGSPDAILTGHSDWVTGALVLADGRFLSRSRDKTLRLWRSDGSPDAILTGHTYAVIGALALADGRFLSWSRDDDLRLWHSDGSPDAIFTGHGYSVTGVVALADGRFLFRTHDNTLRLWDQIGKLMLAFYGDASITCCDIISQSPLRVVIGDSVGRVIFLRLVE